MYTHTFVEANIRGAVSVGRGQEFYEKRIDGVLYLAVEVLWG